ncbi:MAG: hypothetical protein MJZ55_00140 [Paludibacteraceae bacterium]|nr:hypothetical protein [Paludibacteraceae bacterium]
MESIKTALGKVVRWVRNEDTNKALMAAIEDTKTSLLTIINDNERGRLRSEIVRYYNRALANQPISAQEYSYLVEEIYTKYTALGGNGIAKHMMATIEAYVIGGNK